MGRRGFMGCVGLALSATGLGAPVVSGTYAARLLDEVMRANPQVVVAAIIATPPRGTAPVVLAGTGTGAASARSEERRVGKECRSRRSTEPVAERSRHTAT